MNGCDGFENARLHADGRKKCGHEDRAAELSSTAQRRPSDSEDPTEMACDTHALISNLHEIAEI